MSFHIRDARLPEDKPQLLAFILALQHFERQFEPDRRVDKNVAEEYFEALVPHALKRNGRVLVAEARDARLDVKLLGWAVSHEEDNDIYVSEAERRYGYISELFVVEEARGMGVGRALIEASEAWARGRGLKVAMIGALSGNLRAGDVYRRAGFAPYTMRLRKYL